eukprot:TRINITY_DN74567_c0_g1_i1.p1 TRINITY_DN74567_c0_g1~~TRINITY_DN74567_c0_g1_i1.p1  ORF type:complete len:444 (+),score=36.01 TRINITY_DN74567_c0_g1_i1:51-1382(+)
MDSCSCFAGLSALVRRSALPRDPGKCATKPSDEKQRLLLSLPSWDTVTNATTHIPHTIENVGVLYLPFKNGQRIVLKKLRQLEDGVGYIVVKELCDKLGICHPEVDVLADPRELQAAIKWIARPVNGWMFDNDRRILHLGSPELVMTHIAGERFLPPAEKGKDRFDRSRDIEEAYKRLHAPGVMTQLGHIMALDIVTNNWDRLPWGLKIWKFDHFHPVSMRGLHWHGNACNLMLTPDGNLHAIASEFKGFFPFQVNHPKGLTRATALKMFLLQVHEVFSDLHLALRERRLSRTAYAVQSFLVDTRQVEIEHEALLRLQLGISEGLDKLWGLRDDLEKMGEEALERIGELDDSDSALGSTGKSRTTKKKAPEIDLVRAVLNRWAETRPVGPVEWEKLDVVSDSGWSNDSSSVPSSYVSPRHLANNLPARSGMSVANTSPSRSSD